MTLFGKFVFTFFGVVFAFLIFYGAASFVKQDTQEIANSTVSSSTQVAQVSDDNASSTLPEASSTAASSTGKEVKKDQPIFTEMLIKGGTQKCSITQSLGTALSSGIVYINNTKVRADFTTSIGSATVHSSMLALNGYMYTWTENASTSGSKVKMPTVGKDGKVVMNSPVKTWNGDQVKDYTCNPWTPDESLFTVPSSVTFVAQ